MSKLALLVRTALLLGLVLGVAPLGAAAQEISGAVAVAARDLPRGAVLGAGDIALRPAEGEVPGAGSAVEEGWVVRRLVREGEVLREPAVAPPPAVRAGEPVQGVVRRGAVELRVWGVALNDAAVGDIVHLRTTDGRRFTGTASGTASATLAIRER